MSHESFPNESSSEVEFRGKRHSPTHRLPQPLVKVSVVLGQFDFRSRLGLNALDARDVILDECESRFFTVQRLEIVLLEGQRHT